MPAASTKVTPIDPSWIDLIADPVRLHLLRCLTERGEATATELAVHGHASDATFRRHLDTLVSLGLVLASPGENDGLASGRPAARFRLDPSVHQNLLRLFETLSEPLRPAA